MTDLLTMRCVVFDEDGYFRRTCPHCRRDFKWSGGSDSFSPGPDEHYFCPYCGKPEEPSRFFTDAQSGLAARILEDEGLESLMAAEVTFQLTKIPPQPELIEPNDMRKVSFVCHPDYPAKVCEDWTQPTFCGVCGSAQDD